MMIMIIIINGVEMPSLTMKPVKHTSPLSGRVNKLPITEATETSLMTSISLDRTESPLIHYKSPFSTGATLRCDLSVVQVSIACHP